MKARQFFYVTLASLGVLVLGGGAGYYFASIAIHNKTDALKSQMASEIVIDDQINELADMKRTYQKLVPIIPQINEALPKDKRQSEVALQLQQLASNAGMTLPSVTFAGANSLPASTSQTIKSGAVLALPITFTLAGTYDQLLTFLRSIEQLNRYTGVGGLSISHKDDKNKTLNFNMSVNVYIKP